jgi:hypothetical protein
VEYPRKVARVAAEKAAKKISPEEWPLVIEGVRKYKKVWTDKQYIPYPATFLNQQRWQDEIETIEESKKETASSVFLHTVRSVRSFPGNTLSKDIIETFNKIGIHWERLKTMSDEEIKEKFNQNYGKEQVRSVSNVVDFQKRASGDNDG